MKVKLIILDNDGEYGKDVADIISLYSEDFFQSLSTSITKIEATSVKKSKDAFDLIKKGGLDILSLDIELDDNERGDDSYERLFYDGVAIPAIVVSAVVDTKESVECVFAKGVSSILHIARGDSDVAERLAKEVCKVLGNRDTKIKQVQTYVKIQKIEDVIMECHGKEMKTIEWIKSIIEGNHSPIEEKEINDELVRECNNKTRLEEDHNPGFMRDS